MKNNKFIYIFAFMFITLINMTFSKILWFLPFQILFENFYSNYLTYENGGLFFWIVISLFLLGSIKITYWEFKHHKEYNLFTKSFFIPLSFFMKQK